MTSHSLSGAAVLQSPFGAITPFTLNGLPYDLRAAVNDPNRQAGMIDPDDPNEYRQPDPAQGTANAFVPSADGTGPLLAPGMVEAFNWHFVDGIGYIRGDSIKLLQRISEDFVVVVTGGKTPYVLVKPYDSAGNPMYQPKRMGSEGFKAYVAAHYGTCVHLRHRLPDGSQKEEQKDAGAFWINLAGGSSKRIVHGITMEPTAATDDPLADGFNRFHILSGASRVKPDPAATMDDIKPLTDHLKRLADGDEAPMRCLLNTLAWNWQHQDERVDINHLLVNMNEGTGKSLICALLQGIFGTFFVAPLPGSALEGDFTDHLDSAWFAVFDEISTLSPKALEHLKTWATSPQRWHNPKGLPGYHTRNFTQTIICTNDPYAIRIPRNARRWNVFLSEQPPLPKAEYAKLFAWIGGPGPALIAGVFDRWDFKGWTPHDDAPQSLGALKVQRGTRSGIQADIEDMRDAGISPFDRDFVTAKQVRTVLMDALSYSREQCSKTAVGRALHQALRRGPEQMRIAGAARDGKSMPVEIHFVRNRDEWKAATSEQRAKHLETGERLPGMVKPGEEVIDHEQA